MKIAFIVAPFGFGPAAKAIAIATQLEKRWDLSFASTGPALELAGSSHAFSGVWEFDFDTPQSENAKLREVDAAVVVNTTRFNALLAELNVPFYFVDTMAWARSIEPSGISFAEAYFAQNFFDHQGFLTHFSTPRIDVGIIRQRDLIQSYPERKHILVHLGGLHSPVISEHVSDQYLRHVLRVVEKFGPNLRIVLPPQIPLSSLAEAFHPSVIRCSANDVPHLLKQSAVSVTTPGIEHIYESYLADTPTYLLPSFNTSQVLQTRYLRRKNPDALLFRGHSKFDEIDCSDVVGATTKVHQMAMAGEWNVQFRKISESLENDIVRLNRNQNSELLKTQRRMLSELSADGAIVVASRIENDLKNGRK